MNEFTSNVYTLSQKHTYTQIKEFKTKFIEMKKNNGKYKFIVIFPIFWDDLN